MFDYLRTNHELCLTAMVKANSVGNTQAMTFARLAESFALKACIDGMSGYDVKAEAMLLVAKDNLIKCANQIRPHQISIENFKLRKQNNG